MRRLIIEEPYADSALWCRRLALFAAAVIATGILLARKGLDPGAVLAVLSSAIVIACLSLLCAGTATVAIWRTGHRGTGLVLSGALLAALVLAYPAYLSYQAIRLPQLHDISTDIDDPPVFSRSYAALSARGWTIPAPVPAAERQLQLEAYPNVQPIYLDLGAGDTYQTVLSAVAAEHWRLVDSVPPGGRLGLGHVDAVAHGMVLGFPDDITIRITPLAGQTRVDIRAVSRVGRHDFGADARRILSFTDELKAEADQK